MLDSTEPYQWNHCPGLLNPAGDGSRGLLVSSIPSGSHWLIGPAFLFLPKEKWPKVNSIFEPLNDPQAQERTVTWIGAVKDSKDKYFSPAKSSSPTKFLRVTAYPAWFIPNCRLSKSERRIGTSLTERIKQAWTFRSTAPKRNHFLKKLQPSSRKKMFHTRVIWYLYHPLLMNMEFSTWRL